MGIFRVLASLPRMARLNNDPREQKLAALFATAGERDPQRAAQVALVIEDFIGNERWDQNEAAERIAHTLSLVKVQVTWNSDIFERARLIGEDMIQRLTSANQSTSRPEMKPKYATEILTPKTHATI